MNNLQPNLSNNQIKKASLIALISALIIGIVAVLPAEYGKDYTGLGKTLGFSKLYVTHQDTTLKSVSAIELPTSNFILEEIGSEPKIPKPKEALGATTVAIRSRYFSVFWPNCFEDQKFS